MRLPSVQNGERRVRNRTGGTIRLLAALIAGGVPRLPQALQQSSRWIRRPPGS